MKAAAHGSLGGKLGSEAGSSDEHEWTGDSTPPGSLVRNRGGCRAAEGGRLQPPPLAHQPAPQRPAALARVLDQAVRDEVIDRNRVDVSGWRRQLARHEDELDDPRARALPDWATLEQLTTALTEASADRFRGWGDVVMFAACTATRIGEVSGCRVRDIDTEHWVWTLRRQTTPGPGGLQDKGTKGKRSRPIPLIEEIRPLILRRINEARARVERGQEEASEKQRREAPLDARLFLGPRGGRIQTGVLRDATHWDEAVTKLGYEHLRRHDLRHTGLTWFADAGVPVHRLQRNARHTIPGPRSGTCTSILRHCRRTANSCRGTCGVVPDRPQLCGWLNKKKSPPTQVRGDFTASG